MRTAAKRIGPFDVTPPRRALPAGAWDCHAHCFGPFDRFPLPAGLARQPIEAHGVQYLEMLDHVGLTNGVLVHGSAYRFDNSCTIDAVKNPRLVGIAVVEPTVTDDELRDLRQSGVLGLRFSHGKSPGPGSLPLAALESLGPRLAELGMQAHVWADCADVLAHEKLLRGAPCPLVIDHMGMPARGMGPRDGPFQALVELIEETGAIVKLTPHRISDDWPEAKDVRPLHEAICARVPDQLIWGSDWPFLGMKELAPDVGQRLDLLSAWTQDDDLMNKILVKTPARLFETALSMGECT